MRKPTQVETPVAAREEARVFRNGDMVVTPTGRVALLTELRAFGQSTVSFGAGGPSGFYFWKDLEFATAKQIVDSGLAGVGCNQGVEVGREVVRRRGGAVVGRGLR